MAIHCKNEVLPLHLYFEDVRGNSYGITKVWNKQSEIEYDKLPVLMENARIGLRFYLESGDLNIENVFLRIQTSRYRDIEEKETFTIPLLSKEELYWLYQAEKMDEEFPWRMGVYFIELHLNGSVYIGGFKVIPLHLTVSQVEKMHEFLNEQVHGIIYDLIYSGQSLNTKSNLGLPEYWYYDYARQLSEYYTGFMHSMVKLTKHPHEYIQTIYKPSLKQGRMDGKSIRWAISSKGQAKNWGAVQHLYTFNKIKQSYINTKPNQWLRNILIIWSNDISEVALAIQKDKDNLNKRLNQLKLEYDVIIARKEKLANRKNVGENTRRDIKSRLIMHEKDRGKVQNQLYILNSWLELLYLFENKIEYFLNHTFLTDVDRNFNKPIFKDYHYHKVDSMFEAMQKIEKEKGETVKLTPILKPTWQIYEYYCLFKVIDIFKQLGYTLTYGLKDNIINYYFEDSIPEGSKFIFEKGENVIHIWYDHYHADSPRDSKARGESFYTPLTKKKPDIKVDFFIKKIDSLWHNGTVILDSKFSKFKDIYNYSYNNSISEQLVSYFSFFHTGEGAYSGGRPCVVRVLCLYSGDDSNQIITVKEPITYLRFFPSTEEEERVSVGEVELLQIFQDVLDSFT